MPDKKPQPQRSSTTEAVPIVPPRPTVRPGWREPAVQSQPFGFLRFLAAIYALGGAVTVVLVPLAVARFGGRTDWTLLVVVVLAAGLGIGQMCFAQLIFVVLAVESHLRKIAERDED